jgi:ABC-type bacteriocin/lantibiotic exporter with double-glycine peptidase domain
VTVARARHRAPLPLAALFGGGTPDLSRLARILLALGWMQRRLLLPALAAAGLLAVLALLPPALLAHLIDVAFADSSVRLVAGIGAGIACIGLVDAVASLVRRVLSAEAGLSLYRDMLVPAFAAVLRLPVDHALARDQGLLGRTFEEAERLAQGAAEGVLEFVLALAMIVVLAAAMLYVSPLVGLVVLAIIAGLAAAHALLARSLRRREAAWFTTRSRYWAHLVEAIAYTDTLRVNAAHGFAEARFRDRLGNDVDAHLVVIRISACLDALGRLAGGLIIAGIAVFGGLRVTQGAMSIGDFVLFLSVGGSLSVPVLALVRAFDDCQAMMVSAARVSELAGAPGELVGAPLKAPPRPAHLAIERVTFAYAGGAAVLSDVSCRFAPGERVALVGPSGIGKSTLASLIFAARQPQAGCITFDGVPLAQIPLDELRRRIVVAPHEIDVFTGSVAENIALAPGAFDRDAVEAAAVLAALDADIRNLPQGFDTLIGQGGVELSAGQKQRLGIARALLRKPDILVLDESTSALDLATEARVLDNLLGRFPGMTLIAITHRASVVARMDRVVEI